MSRYIDAEPKYIDAKSLRQKWVFRGKDGKPYRDEIDAMPSADVAPIVHGQWIEIESNKFPYNNYVGCSVCKEEAKKIVVGGKLYLDKWYDEYDYFKSEYCPHCGARMDGEATDADEDEVVHGKWEECEIVQERLDEPIIDEWQSARCSVCGKYHTTPYMYHFDHFNYCPNCGSKMERREDAN